MARPSPDFADRERLLDRIIADSLAAADAGETIELDELCSRYPDLAGELRAFFEGQERLDRWASPLSPAPEITSPGGTRPFGDYDLLEEIGRGGMGVVYRARQRSLGRTVALKMIGGMAPSSDALQRFQREARSMARIQHPNIVPVYEVGNVDGTHYYTMAYVVGPSVAQLIGETREEAARRPKGRSSTADSSYITRVIEQTALLAEGLEEAHRQGLVHRDVKPSNILIDETGRYVLLDFGLVRDAGERTITRSGAILGTLQYMSPEQVSGSRVGPSSDVYSLGATLYELVTLHPASDAESEHGLQTAILSDEPASPRRLNSRVNHDLETILLHALEKSPERRYESAGALAGDLRRFLGGQPIMAQPQSRISKLTRGAWKHKAKIVSGVVLMILVAVVWVLLEYRAELRKYSAIRSLAVLPFASAETDASVSYLVDGLTENLIGRLSRLPELRVLARSTVFQYKDREINPIQVGKDLNVRAVVTGQAAQVGDDLTVDVELVNVVDGSRLWGDRYEAKLDELLTIQQRIANGVSRALQPDLTPDQQSGLTKRYTESVEAYRLYLTGRFFSSKRTPENLKKAIQHFEEAIDLDPDYALAYAGLADAYSVLGNYSVLPPRECHPKAEAAARRALEIDESLPEAHTSLASVLFCYHFDWLAAEKHFKRAIQLDPNSVQARIWYADGLTMHERFEEAMHQTEQARKLDPLSRLVLALRAMHLYLAGRYDPAFDRLQELLDLDPDFYPAHWFLGQLFLQRRQPDEAIAELTRARDLSGGSPYMRALLGYAYARAGRSEETRAVIAELENLSRTSYVTPLGLAILHMSLEDRDRAFEYLEKAYEDRNWLLWTLKTDPIFGSLHTDRRYSELIERMGYRS